MCAISILDTFVHKQVGKDCHADNAPLMPNYMNRMPNFASPLFMTSFPTDMQEESESQPFHIAFASPHRDLTEVGECGDKYSSLQHGENGNGTNGNGSQLGAEGHDGSSTGESGSWSTWCGDSGTVFGWGRSRAG